MEPKGGNYDGIVLVGEKMENWRELLKDKPVKYWIRTEIEKIIKDKSVDRERFYEYSAKRTIMNPVVTDYTLKRRLVDNKLIN